MAEITIKQHDTKVTFTDTPTINGVVQTSGDLAGCTLKFIMKGADSPIIQTATINPDGTFKYDAQVSDVGTVGDFKQEWEVTYPSGKILSFPNNTYNLV